MANYENIILKEYKKFVESKKKYSVKTIPIKSDLFKLIYDSDFTDEWDNSGYIFYKPILRKAGRLYMFKGTPYEIKALKKLKGLQFKKRFTRIIVALLDHPDYSMKNKAETHILISILIDLAAVASVTIVPLILVWLIFFK